MSNVIKVNFNKKQTEKKQKKNASQLKTFFKYFDWEGFIGVALCVLMILFMFGLGLVVLL